MPLILDTLILS